MGLQEDRDELGRAVRELGDAVTRAVLPFYAWLLPKLGLRLKPRYQAMLDEDR